MGILMGILDTFEPLYKLLPEVKSPEVQPPLKKRLIVTALVLVLFYVMGNITIIGLNPSAPGVQQMLELQYLLASHIGTLITVGIGPIVLASIILQLLVGGKIISIDLSQPRDKARFTSMQKLFAIVLCFFEAATYVVGGFLAPLPGMLPIVILQVAFGAILLLYLDEVVSKHGIGSGIGLFIAGGVAAEVLWRIFNPLNAAAQFNLSEASGLVFLFVNNVGSNILNAVILYLLPIITTLIIFFVVVFAEGIHVNIPITMGRHGMGGRFPVKLLYVSNIPVILTVALFANIRIMSLAAKNLPLVGGAIEKLGEFVTAPYGVVEKVLLQGSIVGLEFQLVQGIVYLFLLVVLCVVFGKFWVEMGGQGAEAVANQLQRSGMFIPGFRRDPRIIQGILERYIPPITILGSAFVGLLAGFADLTSALGSGTGILLTVGIVYRLYEELAKQQLMETHPLLKKFFG